MNKLDKLNQLVFEYKCQFADVETRGKGIIEASKLLNDTIKERRNYIAELADRDEPMAIIFTRIEDYKTANFWDEPTCPKCKSFVIDGDKFCRECGQRLDWGKENE